MKPNTQGNNPIQKRKYQHTPAFNVKQMINYSYKNMGELQMRWIEANKLYLGGAIQVKWDRFYYLKQKIRRIRIKIAEIIAGESFYE